MMSNALDVAQDRLLAPAGLTVSDLERVMGQLLGHRIDSGDLYFQSVKHESFVLEDGIVKEGSYNVDHGVGVRAMSGEKTGFAYSDDIILPALEQAAVAARSIAKHGGPNAVNAYQWATGHELYLPVNPLISASETDKVALLQRIDTYTRSLDSRV